MATTETRKMVLAAAAICDEKKAENTRVLELDPADSGFTDFFLITSGTNTRQTVAIADDIELKMKREFATYPNSVEGRRTGEWILMDYVDFVVHIFVEEKRAFYDIERLRKSARSIDLPQLKAALAEKTAAVRRSHPRPSETAPTRESTPAPEQEPAGKLTKRTGRKVAAKRSLMKGAARKTAKAPTRSAASKKAPAKKSSTRLAAANEAGAKKAPAKKAAAKKTSSSRKSPRRSPEE